MIKMQEALLTAAVVADVFVRSKGFVKQLQSQIETKFLQQNPNEIKLQHVK